MNTINPFHGRRFFGRFGSVCAACAALAAPASGQSPADGTSPSDVADAGADSPINVTPYGVVDLAIQDTELANVLEMLAIQSQKNIVLNKNVSATVTAYLYDVTFHEALDAILRPNGYGYKEEGNFIYIYTLAELAEMEIANRTTEPRIFELEHMSAKDANELITPLLSEKGKASFKGDVPKGIQPTIADAGADDYAFTAKLVVNDYPENLDAIARTLEELDQKPKQVLVESTILQTTVDEANAFGVDFSVIGDINFSDLTDPLSVVTNLLSGSDEANGFEFPDDNRAGGVASTVGNTAGPGGLKVGIVSDDISVFLRVLDQVTDTTVLARPKIMALNRQRAQVLVGAKVGYLSTTATETTTTQSVEFLDTGIKLVFRPFISQDGSIRMELAPSVSEASLRTVTDSNGLAVTIPDQLTNELTTNVRIKDGQTLVLGGLYKESTSITRNQVPFLGDVPFLGAAFRGQDDTVRRDEIIFLITPTVVQDEVLWAVGQDALEFTETARVGMRADLLPFSREKLTANHNQDAVNAYNAGDTALALHHVNHSLRLNSNQPEMIQFRDAIGSADPSRSHERSVLERVLRKEQGAAMTSGLQPGATEHLQQLIETPEFDIVESDGSMVFAEDRESAEFASSEGEVSPSDEFAQPQEAGFDSSESGGTFDHEGTNDENTESEGSEFETESAPNENMNADDYGFESESSSTLNDGGEFEIHDLGPAVSLPFTYSTFQQHSAFNQVMSQLFGPWFVPQGFDVPFNGTAPHASFVSVDPSHESDGSGDAGETEFED